MTPIPIEFINRILDETDIVEWIGSCLPLKPVGTFFKGLCPFHQEKTPSFTVNPNTRLFHCFGCRKNGTVIDFVMAYENLSYSDAALKIAKRSGIQFPVGEPEDPLQSD